VIPSIGEATEAYPIQ